MTDSAPGGRPAIAGYARAVRGLVPEIAVEVADRIQSDVPAYAGPPDGRRHELIAHAVEQAIHRFLDLLDGLPHRERGLDEMFHALGRAESADAGDMAALRAALRLALAATWDGFRRVGTEHPASDEALGRLADELFRFVAHLVDQAERGFTAGRRAIAADRGLARSRLAERLLSSRQQTPLEEIDPKVWTVPRWVVVAVTDPGSDQRVDIATLSRTHLVVRHDHRLIVIADASQGTAVSTTLSAAGLRVATSWPVPPSMVPSAFRWARRALDLVDKGVIPERPVISCRDHRTQIWLHAEPAIRQRMCQDLLKPLLAETPNSREILSQTLLTWLEMRDSAPAIASELGIHAQTVRYRWKRINELFGDDLHDPEFMVQITMLLKASVPLWQAGDQSDFERFRAEESV